MMKLLIASFSISMLAGCSTAYQILEGPVSCKKLCDKWELEFSGMVGVGEQNAYGPLVASCICTKPESPADQKCARRIKKTSATLTHQAAIIAIKAAAQNNQQKYQSSYPYSSYSYSSSSY